MARDGTGIYSPLPGTAAVSGETVKSSPYNALVADLAGALNSTPISVGGTGATSAAGARTSLDVYSKAETDSKDAAVAVLADIHTASAKSSLADLDEFGITDSAASFARRRITWANVKAAIASWFTSSYATLTSLEGLSLVQGDTLYATAADTLARLAKGTAGQVKVMNAGATAPEWETFVRIRAWVKFNGTTATIVTGSSNVSSIVRNSTGDYSINFSPALATASYANLMTSTDTNAGAVDVVSSAAAALNMRTRAVATNNLADSTSVNVAIIY